MLTAKQKIILAREKKNEKLKHVSLEMETSTHFPVLMKVVQMSQGPILELGSGLFSTPLLHWMCFPRDWFGKPAVPGRKLITCESYRHYLEFASKFNTDTHDIRFVKDWAIEDFGDEHFSVVFIDHSPKKPWTRGHSALQFKDKADYIVLHDAGPDPNPKYGYKEIYPHFREVFHWEGAWPATTVLSNTKSLTNFFV